MPIFQWKTLSCAINIKVTYFWIDTIEIREKERDHGGNKSSLSSSKQLTSSTVKKFLEINYTLSRCSANSKT
jgi:hypothetical protein